LSKITDIILSSIEEFNDSSDLDSPISNDLEVKLFGSSGQLDSIGLVNLIVIIEEQIDDELDINISIASEKAMSQKRSPFRSIAALSEFVELLVQDEKNA